MLSKCTFFHTYVFQNYFFPKKYFRYTIRLLTVSFQVRTEILLVLLWVQTLCKGYQQATKVSATKENLKKVKADSDTKRSRCFLVVISNNMKSDLLTIFSKDNSIMSNLKIKTFIGIQSTAPSMPLYVTGKKQQKHFH